MTEKYCVKCGKKFMAIGRQVICPACKAAAEEETKRAAVLKAKRASWTGESVPVRISGRASTVIREYGAKKGLSFAAALDDLLKSTDYFKGTGSKWEEVEPYRSHRRDKHTTETETKDMQEVKQEEVKTAAGKPQEAPQGVAKAAKVAKTTSKAKTVKK